VLAARSAALTVSTPLGTAIGGPIVAGVGAGWTLTASGAATVLLAGLAAVLWRGDPIAGKTDQESRSAATEPHLA
jgi:hypothetical protein